MIHIQLPCYGIEIELDRKPVPGFSATGSIFGLKDEQDNHGQGRVLYAAMDAIESLILAHACAGVDVKNPAYIEGIETAVEACSSRFDV